MKFPPSFSLTPPIKKLLYELDVLKAGYELHPVLAEQAVNLRRASLLKSSLFSARIEGNPLELTDIDNLQSNDADRHTVEVSNLAVAYERISEILGLDVTTDGLKKLHALVLRSLSGDADHLRQEESAIYNQAGIAVYLTPAPQQIRTLLNALCAYINATGDHPSVAAGLTHIWFEKNPPVLDGNGRVGRLLSAYILKKRRVRFWRACAV